MIQMEFYLNTPKFEVHCGFERNPENNRKCMIQKCKECQGNEANHSRRTLVIVASSLKIKDVEQEKNKNESRRRYLLTITLPYQFSLSWYVIASLSVV